MCPDTMNSVKEKGIYLPKFNGSQLCLKYHAKGSCFKNCTSVAMHAKLHTRTKQLYDEFSHAIDDAAERHGRITINKRNDGMEQIDRNPNIYRMDGMQDKFTRETRKRITEKTTEKNNNQRKQRQQVS